MSNTSEHQSAKKRQSVAAQTQVGLDLALGNTHSLSRRERAEAAHMAA